MRQKCFILVTLVIGVIYGQSDGCAQQYTCPDCKVLSTEFGQPCDKCETCSTCIDWLNSKSVPDGLNKTFIESDPTLMMKRIIKNPKAGNKSNRIWELRCPGNQCSKPVCAQQCLENSSCAWFLWRPRNMCEFYAANNGRAFIQSDRRTRRRSTSIAYVKEAYYQSKTTFENSKCRWADAAFSCTC